MKRRLPPAIGAAMIVTLLAACTGVNAGPRVAPEASLSSPAGTVSATTLAPSSTSSEASSSSATPGSESPATEPDNAAPQNPNGVPGVPTNEDDVAAAIDQIDDLAQEAFNETGIPGMAVAVVHDGEVVFAKGYGVREVGKPDKVDADTVFQLASVSKSIGATVIAKEVGDGVVTWDTPVIAHLPTLALSDPYVTQNVTIADMYSHRSGLPGHAGDRLEDLGYDQAQIFERMKLLPLNPFRAVYNYTNFGMTMGAESVAAAAGTDWPTLSDQAIYEPLGMSATSSRFSDFQAAPNHASGHVLVDGGYQAKYVRDPDAQTPAGGVSASVTDVATWLAMVLNEGKAADGTQVVDPEALRAALTPVIRSVDGSPVPNDSALRAGFYGYGVGVGNDSTGRVRLSHSGAFYQGTGTTYLAIPNLDLGIVVLTNATANGTAEGVANSFADVAEFGTEQIDWLAGYRAALSGVDDPAGELAGQTPPANPTPAAPNAAFVGTYQNDFWGPVTITESGSELVLTAGPNYQQFPLTHWDGSIFTMVPTGENAPDGSVSEVSFELSGDTASALTVEFWNQENLGTFRR
jgi:CubicO group peptidase (beta-lactamase class C family)